MRVSGVCFIKWLQFGSLGGRSKDFYQSIYCLVRLIRRKDDIEEKWVVVPDGMTFSKEEIRRQIHFQEQYFDSEIVM